MTSKRAERKTLIRAGAASLITGMILAVTGLAGSSAGAYVPDPTNHKIEICHATASDTNPYTTPSPAKWQITAPNGHAWDDGDIIPPFPAGTHGGKSWAAFPGLNWTTANEAFYDAHCGESQNGPQTADVTLAKVVTGDAAPDPALAGYDFSVECDSGVVADATPTVAPGGTAVPVATGVEVDDTCTITETTVLPAGASVGFNTGTPGTNSTTVTIDADGVAVVATNTYNSTGGGGCETNCGGPTPTADLSASQACKADGMLITLTNKGDAAGVVDVTNGGDLVGDDVNVPAGGSTDVLVPVEEDTDYLIDVSHGASKVASFKGPKNCDGVAGEVITPTPKPTPKPTPAPAPAPVVKPVVAPAAGPAVGGLVQARELPRTGNNTLPLAGLGFGLVLLGGAAIVASRRMVPVI